MDNLLHGPCRLLLDAAAQAGLDVRLRGDYLNFYLHGRSLAKLSGRQRGGPKLEIHHKYLVETRLAEEEGHRNAGPYVSFDVDDALAKTYVGAVDEIVTRAVAYSGSEETVEAKLMRQNGVLAPICCFDRQVQVPGATGKLDMMGLHGGDTPTMVAIELKCYPDPRIQGVPKQLLDYLQIFDPSGDGLRPDVAESYKLVCDQLRRLGLSGPDPAAIFAGMPVQGLVVLTSNNPRSQLLERAHQQAARLSRPIYLWQPEPGEDALRIPERTSWVRMGS